MILAFKFLLLPYPAVRKSAGGYHLYSKSAYVGSILDIEKSQPQKVVQFFNPWITQHVFACEFFDFLESMKHLSSDEAVNAYVINGLLEKIKVLWANKEVEPQIITEISDAFVKNEGIFLKQQNLSFSILPLAIELYDLTKQKVFLDFVEGSVNMLASKKVPSSDLI